MVKVLCIDDEPLIRMTTCDYLTDIGHEVLEAECGEQGLALFREHGPDVILTDLRMPGGDGFLVVEQVARLSPETPTIILSGAGNVGDAMDALGVLRADVEPKCTEHIVEMIALTQGLIEKGHGSDR